MRRRPARAFACVVPCRPGSVTLAWTFDLPRAGTTAKIPVALPFRTFTYRVISEAPEGMKLEVSDFPEAERVKDEGRDLLFTQIQRSPQEAKLESFTIKLDGIPGPGPGRWIASGLALFAAVFGLSRAFQASTDNSERKALIAARKHDLLAQAGSPSRSFRAGRSGPSTRPAAWTRSPPNSRWCCATKKLSSRSS